MKYYLKYFWSEFHWIYPIIWIGLSTVFWAIIFYPDYAHGQVTLFYAIESLGRSLVFGLGLLIFALSILLISLSLDHKDFAREIGTTTVRIQIALFVYDWTVTYIRNNRYQFKELFEKERDHRAEVEAMVRAATSDAQ